MAKNKSNDPAEHRASVINDLHVAKDRLKSWSELTETVRVPVSIAAALSSGRAELVDLIDVHPLSEDEVRDLYHLIKVLIETNLSLRAHAREIAKMAENLRSQLKGSMTGIVVLEQFANFRDLVEDDEEA